MPAPKVFISSTCYNLSMAREQLRSFLLKLGYEPVMSEYSDVLYDPRTHTHTSCLQEVPNADLFIVLIGSRFGGTIVPEALNSIDIESLVNSSFDVTILDNPEKLSITQLEVLKAIDSSVPVFAFIDEKVMHDHHVYQKNKELVDKIHFPSIDKPESARYIFEFINFLTHRNKGNSVISFRRVEDIEIHLRKQWSSLFQRLLREQRDHIQEEKKLFSISEQIEDLKTAIISTIGNAQNRDVARGVIKYRRLIDFLSGLHLSDVGLITTSTIPFEQLLEKADIEKIVAIPGTRGPLRRTALIRSDGTFYELRFGADFLNRIALDWQSFSTLTAEVRQVIFDAISDMGRMGPGILRYRKIKFEDYFKEIIEKDGVDEVIEVILDELMHDEKKNAEDS